MTTTNTEMTIEEATQMMKCSNGMIYPNTDHNRKMIAKVTRNILSELQRKRNLGIL